MDPTDVVLRKEGDGRGRYQRCGAEAGVPGVSRIFAMLSEDEVRHAEALRALQDGARVDLAHSATLDRAKTILRRLVREEESLARFNGDLHVYINAMDFEASCARICGELARQADDAWQRELFLKIAAEDEIHFTLLEQMRELLESSSVGAGKGGAADAN
jgi:hypothetical protein